MFYAVKDHDREFFKEQQDNCPKLNELLKKYDPDCCLTRKVCGYHRFLRLKYEELRSKIQDHSKFERMLPKEKTDLFRKVRLFLESFLRDHNKLCYPLFNELISLLDKVLVKSLKSCSDIELQSMACYLRSLRPYCYKFSVMRALSEDNSDSEF